MASPKTGPSGGGSAPAKAEYKMPRPPAIVVWRNAPGGDTAYAIVTKYNKSSVSLMIFPPESRSGVPKDGVRFIEDPWNKTQGVNSDSGVWEFTEETTLLRILASASIGGPDGGVSLIPPEASALLARYAR